MDAIYFNTELAQFLKSLRPRYKTATLSNAWLDAREAMNSNCSNCMGLT